MELIYAGISVKYLKIKIFNVFDNGQILMPFFNVDCFYKINTNCK